MTAGTIGSLGELRRKVCKFASASGVEACERSTNRMGCAYEAGAPAICSSSASVSVSAGL
jgi:hypothetical protein